MQSKQQNRSSLLFVFNLLVFCLIMSGCVTDPSGRAGQNRLDTEDWTGMKLWYQEPAQEWAESLPVGNGRLGAMIFGGTENERLQFNEDTLWTGQPHEYQHGGAAAYLPVVRKLLFEGKQREAEKLAGEQMMSVLRPFSLQREHATTIAGSLKSIRKDGHLSFRTPAFQRSDHKEYLWFFRASRTHIHYCPAHPHRF